MLQVLKNWASLQRSQWMRRESLSELQDKRLRKIVSHAYRNVPFYRKLYQTTGFDPYTVTSINTLRKLTLISKDQLRAVSLEDRTASGIDLTSCRPHTTSGSTGVPVQLLEDPVSFAYRDALNLRFLWAYGARPQDCVVRLRTSGVPGSALPRTRLGDTGGTWAYLRRKCTRQLTYDTDLHEHLRMLAKLKPDVLMADSAYCRALARLSEITEKSLSFRFVVTSSAVLDPSTRKFIGDKFQAEVYDHYGIEEVGGSIAWECPTHSGYHTNAESLLLEFLSNGEPVQAGEAGEVCVTSFHRIATPIIRYLDGDIAIQVNDECNCGRGLPLIREIQGRAMDFIASENGKYISPMAIVAALQNTPGVDQFKVTQREDYSIEIQAAIYRGDPEVVTQEVRRRCYLLFGIMPFNVSLVGKIEGSQGRKYRVVESHIGM